jgi:hypothetical protein
MNQFMQMRLPTGMQASTKTIGSVICQGDGFLFSLEFADRKYRPENLNIRQRKFRYRASGYLPLP